MLLCGTVAVFAAILVSQGGAQPLAAALQRAQLRHIQTATLLTTVWSRSKYLEWVRTLVPVVGSLRALPPGWIPDESAWSVASSADLPDVRRRGPANVFETDKGLEMRWYRLRYESNATAGVYGLYYSRTQASDGVLALLRTTDGWAPLDDSATSVTTQWVRPTLTRLPPLETAPGQTPTYEILLAVPVWQDMFFVTPTFWVGPLADVQRLHDQRWFWQVTVPQSTALALLALGGFAFAYWLRRRQESAYLLFALLCLAWVLRNLHYHIDVPRQTLANDWFWWMTNAALAWVMTLMYLFALTYASKRWPRVERSLMAFVLLSSVATFPYWDYRVDYLVSVHTVNAVVGLFVTGFVSVLAWRGSRELKFMAFSMCLGLVLGVHDLMLLQGRMWPEHIYLMPFATLVILVAFMYAVLRRYLQAVGQAEHSADMLQQRLNAQETLLHEQHERLLQSERQHTLMLERQRLMHDMHDGLGSTLLSSLAAVERGAMSAHEVTEVLRQCTDDLRLVIDSLEPVEHDIATLLATLRFRLGPRLDAAGLSLHWDMAADLPSLPWLEPAQALQVLRVVQEALTNVLKHAHARSVHICARAVQNETGIEICIADDGQGFSPHTVDYRAGRGVHSMQLRAQRLGASLETRSVLGRGTQVLLTLPVRRESSRD